MFYRTPYDFYKIIRDKLCCFIINLGAKSFIFFNLPLKTIAAEAPITPKNGE